MIMGRDAFGCVVLFLAIANSARASSFAINFAGGGTPLFASDQAGVVPQKFWNNVGTNAVGTLSPITDSNESFLSSTLVSWSSGTTWWTSDPTPTPDIKMMLTSLTDYTPPGVPGTITVSVSGLTAPYTKGGYSVIVYSDQPDNPEDQVTQYTIQPVGGAQTSVWGRDAAGVDFSTLGYVSATATSDLGMATPQANYARFDGLTASSFTASVSTGARTPNNFGGYLRSPVTGIQVIAAPEPASFGVLAIAALTLLTFRRGMIRGRS